MKLFGLDMQRKSCIDNIFIKPRDRIDPKPWSLGYNHYAIISKYIYSDRDLAALTMVCTRSTAPFNLHQNLSVNVRYPSDWWKINTHVIYTDRDIPYAHFIQDATKMYKGSMYSFYKYLDASIYIMVKRIDKTYDTKVLFYDRPFPTELISIIDAYLKAYNYRLYVSITSTDVTVKDIDRDKLYDMYATAQKKVISITQLEEVCVSLDDKDTNIIAVKIADIITDILYDGKDIMIGTTKVFDKGDDSTVTINGIHFPAFKGHGYINELKDMAVVNEIIPLCTHRDSFFPTTSLCGISADVLRQDTIHYELEDKTDVLYNKNLRIMKRKVVVFSMWCYKPVGEEVHSHHFYVVYLPIPLYNIIVLNHLKQVDPINDKYVYVKGTNVIISRFGKEECMYDMLSNTLKLDCNMDTDYESIKGTRFIDYIEVMDTDELDFTGTNNRKIDIYEGMYDDKISMLNAKYGYVLSRKYLDFYNFTVRAMPDMDVIKEISGIDWIGTLPIDSLVYDTAITTFFRVFNGGCAISTSISSRWSEGEVDDNTECMYTKDGVKTYSQCLLEERYYSLLSSLIKDDFVLYYLIFGNNDFDHVYSTTPD